MTWWQQALIGAAVGSVLAYVGVRLLLIGRLFNRPRRGRIVLHEQPPWHVPVRFVRDRQDRTTFIVVYDRPGWRRRPMPAELRDGETLEVDRISADQTISVKFASRH